MSGTLNKLFDYQKFAGNERLGKMIKATESRMGGMSRMGSELSDDDLTMVNAAGPITSDMIRDVDYGRKYEINFSAEQPGGDSKTDAAAEVPNHPRTW